MTSHNSVIQGCVHTWIGAATVPLETHRVPKSTCGPGRSGSGHFSGPLGCVAVVLKTLS